MKKIIPLAVLLLLARVAVSQGIATFSRFLGDSTLVDWATGMVVKEDTFYIVGEDYDKIQSYQNFVLHKTNLNAIEIKNTIYNRASKYVTSGAISSIRITEDNFIISAGCDLDSKKSKGLLYKYNTNLDSIFVKDFTFFDSLNVFFNITELSDSNYLLIGSTSQTSSFNGYDAWFVKTDRDGKIIWQKTFGCNGVDFGGGGAAYNGGVVVGWYYWDCNDSIFDYNLINLDNAGNVKWIKKLGSPKGTDSGGNIIPSKDGGFIVDASIDSATNHNSVLDPDVIHKLDSNGNVIWKSYLPQITKNKSIHKVLETSTGSIVLAGNIPVFQGTTNIPMLGWLVKLGSDGRIIWNQNYYTTLVNDQYLLDVKETPDGGYVACGTAINPATNNQDAWILKVDSNGCLDGFGCPKINYPTAIIPTEVEQSHFIIYPNPAISSFTIALTETPFIKEYKELNFCLYDITGRKVKETTLTEQTTTIQREDISAGVYLYQIREGERSIKNGKLILK